MRWQQRQHGYLRGAVDASIEGECKTDAGGDVHQRTGGYVQPPGHSSRDPFIGPDAPDPRKSNLAAARMVL